MILPKYVIKQREIGKGAFGYVFSVKFQDKTVALKSLPKNKTRKDQWIREVWMMQQLESSAKVPMYIDLDEDDSYYYIFMELISGTNAGDMFLDAKDGFTIPENLLQKWCLDMALLLKDAQSKGIVINDIKPRNMIVTMNEAKMVDMGSCRSVHDPFIRPVGTPLFYSPEKLNHTASYASDMWSLGVSMYMLACGYHPYVRGSPMGIPDIKKDVFQYPLKFEPLYWDNRSQEMKDLLVKMLDKDDTTRITVDDVLNHSWFV